MGRTELHGHNDSPQILMVVSSEPDACIVDSIAHHCHASFCILNMHCPCSGAVCPRHFFKECNRTPIMLPGHWKCRGREVRAACCWLVGWAVWLADTSKMRQRYTHQSSSIWGPCDTVAVVSVPNTLQVHSCTRSKWRLNTNTQRRTRAQHCCAPTLM